MISYLIKYSLLFFSVMMLCFAIDDQPYYSLDLNELNNEYIEYEIIKNDSLNQIFIFNQPFSLKDLSEINVDKNILYSSMRINDFNVNDFNFDFTPGLTINEKNIYSYFNISSFMKLDKTSMKLNVSFDRSLKDNEYYYGDKGAIVTGYVKEAYLHSQFGNLIFFSGRVSRNYGIPNEKSLIFSNNHYPFDHLGFKLSNHRTSFSFYFSRINDMKNSVDSQGIVVPSDSTMTTKRFFSFQHVDFILSKKMQLGLSQSIIYGGPYQSFEFPYINPINFYYADQRNSLIQMNGFWQLLFNYKISKYTSFYIDFLVDDFIINTGEPEYHPDDPNERSKYPDRLGLIIKLSTINLFSLKSLSSITYTRISNETYITFRNFENYIYHNQGIGYPYNSYESLKFNFSFFNYYPHKFSLSLNFSRKGDIDLEDVFSFTKKQFPIGPVNYSISSSLKAYLALKNKFHISYVLAGIIEANSFKIFSNNYNLSASHNLKLVYNF